MNSGGYLCIPGRYNRVSLIIASVVWIGKFTGTLVFEPIIERVGHKWTMYCVAVLQMIALISGLHLLRLRCVFDVY